MVEARWKFPRLRELAVGVHAVSWLLACLAGPAAADTEAATPPKSVTLDQLLTLPSALPVESGQRGGLTRAEWSGRFAEAEAEVEAAQADLDASLDKLSELVGETSNWQVGAPGVQAAPSEKTTVNYGLKQEIQRKREDVARAERRLRDLIVEANLAGVPEEWYKPQAPSQ